MIRVSTEDVLNKAYRLAYFLHQDKVIAIRIVAAATLKLNVAMAVQSKRLNYIPVGRLSQGDSRRTDGIRSKALFSDVHLLQRLVYGESEPYERQKESAAVAGPSSNGTGPANPEDLLVYFIKHLVRITTKRNAFYVTLGVSRLLHSYSTLETMEIYNAVIGEPERVKDDYYYRSRKAVLMQEMYQRFGQLIRACRHRRGEERFETQQGSSEQRSLVKECLHVFTPWDTQCPVPSDFDPLQEVITRLTSHSSADENKVEVDRIHAILHPDCFGRLVSAFGYCPPEERMELPRFFSHETNDQSPPRQRRAPKELSAEELMEINHTLAEQAGRRRRSSPTAAIRIIVDGIERGRLNPAEQSSVSFSTDEDTELIEVKTTDSSGDLLLATHLVASYIEEKPDAPIVSSIRLEGGQVLSLSITSRPTEANGAADLLVKFDYQETNPRRAVRLWWQRLGVRLGARRREPHSRSLWGDANVPARPILIGILIVLCLAGYLGYVRLRSREKTAPEQTVAVRQDLPASGSTGGEATTPAPQVNKIDGPENVTAKETGPGRSASPPRPQRRAEREQPAAMKVPTTSNSPTPDVAAKRRDEDVEVETTRSVNLVPNLKLSEVKQIYVEMRGEVPIDQLRRNLVENLGSSGAVAVTGADAADASLKIVVRQIKVNEIQGESQIEAKARLVNARGSVLWPTVGGTRRYTGTSSKVLSEIVKDLLSEISVARSPRP